MTISEVFQNLHALATHPFFEKLGMSLLGLLAALVIVKVIQTFHASLCARISSLQGTTIRGFKIRDYTVWNAAQLTQAILIAMNIASRICIMFVAFAWILWTASLFSTLEAVLATLFTVVETNFKAVLWAVWDYLPRLVFILFVGALTWAAIRLVRLIFGEIERGTIRFENFYTEWARPTSRIIQVIVVIFAVAIIAPNLPGSQSDAFKGISIFVGVLVSLGSTSAVRNAVAGIVLTYMRSYRTKDFVNIANTLGTVIEKGVLVTRVLTPRLEEVSIPNAEVLANQVVNYSGQARRQGVIFHTPVTVVYDVPWKTVEALLLQAARITPDIAQSPEPFVLHSKLHDFYVEYELNVYVTNPEKWIHIYSNLHKNIQEVARQQKVDLTTPTHLHMRGPFPEVTIQGRA